MLDLERWLDKYVEAVDAAFGARIVCVGLQGSCARGEQHEGSDIDVVLVLDELTAEDLKTYRAAIASLPERAKICGFVGGVSELKAWDRADLFQFYHDTKAVYGDLEFLAPLLADGDVRRALHRAACDIYHACAHNFVHERSAEILKGLYKGAVFALQAKQYLASGVYIAKKQVLLPKLTGSDAMVLQTALAWPQAADEEFLENTAGLLLAWAAAIIKNYGDDEDAETKD